MAEASAEPSGPDLAEGVPLAGLADGGKLAGHAGGEPILLVRRGKDVFAVGAQCTHYNGPLAEGLVVGDTVRRPWHHARADLRTSRPCAPAQVPWRAGGWSSDGACARETAAAQTEPRGGGWCPDRMDCGGGAAGWLRPRCSARALPGSIVMLSDDERLLSTGRTPLTIPAGNAQEDWVPPPDSFYAENGIDLRQDESHRTDASGRSSRGRSTVVRRPIAGNWRRAGTTTPRPTSRTCIRSACSATARRSSTMPAARRCGRASFIG